MAKKVIAIGNRLMMDDAVGVVILEKIKNILEDKGIETIIGETDVDFCFSKLNQRRCILYYRFNILWQCSRHSNF